jgi:hypothetical protein
MDFRSAKEKISNYLPELKNMANQTNDPNESFALNNFYESTSVLLKELIEILETKNIYDKSFFIMCINNKLSLGQWMEFCMTKIADCHLMYEEITNELRKQITMLQTQISDISDQVCLTDNESTNQQANEKNSVLRQLGVLVCQCFFLIYLR